MSNKSTYIKLDRNIMNWRWYQNPNTFRVFIHCLLLANIAPKDFEGIKIKRGEFATSYKKMAQALNLTTQQVRTAISHLKLTGELTTTPHSKFLVISIINYGYYQDKSTGKNAGNQHSINIQITSNQQQLKNIKNNKEIKEYNSALSDNGDGDEQKLNEAGLPIIDFGLSKKGYDF